MLYGSVLSMIVAIDATFLAAFFLCERSFTLHVSDPREWANCSSSRVPR
jgi:hypothetical protein